MKEGNRSRGHRCDKRHLKGAAQHALAKVQLVLNNRTAAAAGDPLPAGVQIGDTVKLGQDPAITATRIAPACKKFWDQGNGTGRAVGDAASWTNIMYYRLGEAYLIAAEAYLRMGNMALALERINVLRDHFR